METKTVNDLYSLGIITASDLRRINVLIALKQGVHPAMVAIRYKISKQYVYKLKKRLPKQYTFD